MGNDENTQDLQPLKDSAILAANIRQDEFNLCTKARFAGDGIGFTTHYKAYLAALKIEQKANEDLAQELLSSPTLRTDLAMLDQANSRLASAAAELKSDTNMLNKFTIAADIVSTILGAIAVL